MHYAKTILIILSSAFQMSTANANDRGKANQKKLASIKIPTIDMVELPLAEAIEELRQLVRQHDPQKKGVPFRLGEDLNNDIAINLEMQDVAAADALKFVTQLGGVT